MTIDPSKRFNAEQILNDPWIVGTKTPRKNLPDVTGKIRELNAKRRLKVKPYKDKIYFFLILERSIGCFGSWKIGI